MDNATIPASWKARLEKAKKNPKYSEKLDGMLL